MKDGLADITVVLDRSGSMDAVRADTIGGYNAFIGEQQKIPGECLFTLVQFDDVYETVYKSVPINQVVPLTADTFVPRGSTALLDAIGRTINETGVRLAAMPEEQRPSRVMVIIQTDGGENCSREFNRQRIFEMITHQKEKYSWEFLFLGANQDAISTGATFGISAGKSLTYASNAKGSAEAYKTMSKISSAYRSTGVAPDLDESDRKAQEEAGVTP